MGWLLAIPGLKTITAVLVIGGLASAGFLGFVSHIKHKAAADARQAAIAEMQAATAAESERRQKVITEAQEAAQAAASKASEMENRHAKLLAEIRRLSPARNAAPCVDRAAVRRLLAINPN